MPERSALAHVFETQNPHAAQPDIADQIRKPAELRDAGILTSQEFEAKKADLLQRL